MTFLEAVNESLKRVGLIQGDAGELTTFNDSARQTDIDVMIQVWNEVIEGLYYFHTFPQEVGEDTFTLVANQREYDVASDFEGFVTDPTDETNGHRLFEYPGGYIQLTHDQLQPSNYSGQPTYYVINPQNGKIRLDTEPTSDNAGDVYTYRYTKSLKMESTTDTFPFSDNVVRNLYEATAQLWSFKRKETWNKNLFDASMAMAQRRLNPQERKKTY